MTILVADDDPVSRRLLESTLTRWGHKPVLVADGTAAWEALQQPEAPRIAILDWLMPGMDGLQICEAVRSVPHSAGTYLLLLSARCEKEDLIRGLDAGADDYLTKPFDRSELRARLQVGARVVELQHALEQRVRELQCALEQVKTLEGILSICMYCKRIRNEQDLWDRMEAYITRHSGAQFSHGVCPDCWESEVGPELRRWQAEPKQE